MNHLKITPKQSPLSAHSVSAAPASATLPIRAPHAAPPALPIVRLGGAGQIFDNARLISMLNKLEPVIYSSGGPSLHAELMHLLDMTMGGFNRSRARAGR